MNLKPVILVTAYLFAALLTKCPDVQCSEDGGENGNTDLTSQQDNSETSTEAAREIMTGIKDLTYRSWIYFYRQFDPY